jgi:HlyD family secretion protein
VDVGQTVAATVEAPVLFAIASDLHHMQVEVDIDEGDIDGVRAGERATFQVDAYPGDLFEGRVATVRVQPVADQTTTATVVGTGPAGQTTSTIATVVSYATMIDVGNDDERLRPGMTATVTLDGSRRGEVVRIPNPALSFQPPSEVLDATGQIADVPPMLQAEAADRRVWQYDGRRFTPLPVRTGLTDGQWTELLAGAIEPGQLVVTSASLTDAP